MLGKLLALAAGSAVTFALFFLMQALIASGQSAMSTGETSRIVDFVRVEREETLERKRSKPKRPSNPDAQPPSAPRPSMDDSADVGEAVMADMGSAPIAMGDIGLDIGIGFGIAAGSADGDYLPIVKVAPVYPNRALERGVEGWVLLEFTVSETGAVKDIRVVEFEPTSIFNKSATKAAAKFKYKPRVVDGQAIEVRGVLHKIIFRLED